jgi:hypothetical protein
MSFAPKNRNREAKHHERHAKPEAVEAVVDESGEEAPATPEAQLSPIRRKNWIESS